MIFSQGPIPWFLVLDNLICYTWSFMKMDTIIARSKRNWIRLRMRWNLEKRNVSIFRHYQTYLWINFATYMSLWLWTGAQQRKKQKTTIAIKSLGLRGKVKSFLFKFILLNVLNRLILIQGIQSTCLINRYVQNISWKDLLTRSSIGSSYYLLLKRNWIKIH